MISTLVELLWLSVFRLQEAILAYNAHYAKKWNFRTLHLYLLEVIRIRLRFASCHPHRKPGWRRMIECRIPTDIRLLDTWNLQTVDCLIPLNNTLPNIVYDSYTTIDPSPTFHRFRQSILQNGCNACISCAKNGTSNEHGCSPVIHLAPFTWNRFKFVTSVPQVNFSWHFKFGGFTSLSNKNHFNNFQSISGKQNSCNFNGTGCVICYYKIVEGGLKYFTF